MKLSGSAQLAQQHGLHNYNDLGALQNMKHKAAGPEAERLKAVAQQFESMFVSLMIKSMRDANKVFAEGNMLSSQQGEFYQQMYDSQLAVSLASGKGIGLAKVIEQQLSKDQSAVRPDMEDFQIQRSYDMAPYFERPFPRVYHSEAVDEAVAMVDKAVAELPREEDMAPGAAAMDMDFSSPQKFIESLYPLARQVERETGIDARVMIAQSALETGWGQHEITRADGAPSYNLFGIKAHHSWQGEQAEITTTEYRQGVAMKERAAFRAYESYADSFRDYANFLQSQPRYQQAMQQQDDPKAFAFALQGAGYATDPQYGAKISSILDRYLMQGAGPEGRTHSEVR